MLGSLAFSLSSSTHFITSTLFIALGPRSLFNVHANSSGGAKCLHFCVHLHFVYASAKALETQLILGFDTRQCDNYQNSCPTSEV